MRRYLLSLIWLLASCAPPAAASSASLEEECDGPAIRTIQGLLCVDEFADPADAIQEAINITPNHRRTTLMPVPVELPWGQAYVLGHGVIVDRPVILRGNGTSLEVAEGATALTLTTDADRSVIEDLHFEGPGKFSAVSTGLRVEAHGCHLNRLQVRRIATGIDIRSGTPVGGANANFNNIQGLWATQVGTALYLDGPDSNGGLFQAIECQGVVRCIHDSSFLGNVYIAPSAHASTDLAMEFEEFAAYPTIVGAYLEGRTPNLRVMGANALVVGGLGPNRITDDTRAERVGGRRSWLRFRHKDGRYLRVPIDLLEFAQQ